MSLTAIMVFTPPTFAFIEGLGAPEMLLIFVIILVLFGGEKLPQFARGLGKSIREFKKAAAGVEEEFKRAMEEDDRKKPEPAVDSSAPTAALPAPAAPPQNEASDPYQTDPYHTDPYHEDSYQTETPPVTEPPPAGAEAAPPVGAAPAPTAAAPGNGLSDTTEKIGGTAAVTPLGEGAPPAAPAAEAPPAGAAPVTSPPPVAPPAATPPAPKPTTPGSGEPPAHV